MISEKTRAEAFSDGVFSIAITLLILEFRVPEAEHDRTNQQLAGELIRLWPSLLAFLASFATVLVLWINHHGLFSMLHKIDRTFMFANGLLLLVVVFVPFPTAVLAQNLRTSGANTAAVFYCATYVLLNITFNALYLAAARDHLLKAETSRGIVTKIGRAYRFGFIWYSIAAVIAYFHAIAGTVICSLLWVLWTRLDYSQPSEK